MEAAGQGLEDVCQEFEEIRFGADYDIGIMEEGDPVTFRALIEHAVSAQSQIDQATDKALVAKWSIDRIDPVLRAIFRAAGAELVQGQTPPKVVIVEFIDVTSAFFPNSRELKFVNAVLDHMARVLKPEAFD